MTRIVIIGAGMAGLACARRLAAAGLHPIVVDKGRGVGGRMATRRAGDLQFDHGAPYVTAKGQEFSSVLHGLTGAGHAADWDSGAGGGPCTTGTPGMSAIPKALAAGLSVRLGMQVTALRPTRQGWHIQFDGADDTATHVVITVPAPQVAGILGDTHPMVAQISEVEMSAGLTLMAAVAGDVPLVSHGTQDGSLAMILCDSHKPDRPETGATAFVAHAGIAMCAAHLENSLVDIKAQMLPVLCEHLGVASSDVTHAAVQRWRYARTVKPLGKPFLRATDGTLYLGGDWCVGAQAEDAWTSGTAIAHDMLARL